MKCERCNSRLESNWMFCPHCGSCDKIDDQGIRLISDGQFPRFVSLGGIALELDWTFGTYTRRAGSWSISARFKEGKLIVEEVPKTSMDRFIGQELKRISRKEWLEDNKGYV